MELCQSAARYGYAAQNNTRTEINTKQHTLTLRKPGTERVQTLADILRSVLCCHSNKTCAPTANPPNSGQLEAPPTIPLSYVWVRAVVWECDEGQTDKHTDSRDQYTFHLGYASCEM